MNLRKNVAFLLIGVLVILPSVALSQIDPGWDSEARIFEILDPLGTRLGAVVVAETSNRGYEAGYEYWRFAERSLLQIAEQESLRFAVWAEGDWDDPWVVEALAWQPTDASVEWSHPARVEWTPQDASRPPVVPGGTTFGNATLGALTIRYASVEPSSLTWFKLTEGAFMLLGDGAVFELTDDVPTTGSWWQGPIEPRR